MKNTQSTISWLIHYRSEWFLFAGMWPIAAAVVPIPLLRIVIWAAWLTLGVFLFAREGRHLSILSICPLLFYCVTFAIVPFHTLWPTPIARSIWLVYLVGGFVLIGLPLRSVQWSSPRISRSDIVLFVLCLLCMLFLSAKSLFASITWRGDSDAHINITQHLVVYLYQHPLVIVFAFSCFVLVCLYGVAWKKRYLFLASLCLLGVLFAPPLVREATEWSWRYPLLFYYVNAWSSLSSLLAEQKTVSWLSVHEVDYRLLSFAASALLVWICAMRLRSYPWPLVAVVVGAISSLPALVYYAGLTYIEPLSIVLMTVILFRYPASLIDYVDHKKVDVGLLALVSLGYLKETNLVFSVCVIGIFTFSQPLRYGWRRFPVIPVLHLWILGLLPYLTYLLFRGGARPYKFHFQNILEYSNGGVLVLAFWEQFGLVGVCAVLWAIYRLVTLRIGWPETVMALSALLYIVFYMCDGPVLAEPGMHRGTRYFGYSRFMLYSLPGILCLAMSGMREMGRHHPRKLGSVLLVAMIVNIWMLPVDVMSGSRKSGWGDYTVSTSGHDVPYNALYRYLAGRKSLDRIFIVSRTFDYLDEFYLKKYSLQGVKIVKANRLPRHIEEGDVVVVHMVDTGAGIVSLSERDDMHVEMVFQGWGTALTLLSRSE